FRNAWVYEAAPPSARSAYLAAMALPTGFAPNRGGTPMLCARCSRESTASLQALILFNTAWAASGSIPNSPSVAALRKAAASAYPLPISTLSVPRSAASDAASLFAGRLVYVAQRNDSPPMTRFAGSGFPIRTRERNDFSGYSLVERRSLHIV